MRLKDLREDADLKQQQIADYLQIKQCHLGTYIFGTQTARPQTVSTVLSCLACGEYFVRHSSRQLYCDSPFCQAERNRKIVETVMLEKKQTNRENKLPLVNK